MQLWDGQAGLEHVFPEIDRLAARCRFRDCRHHSEPGCAVLHALEDRSLEQSRYDSYCKLEKELEFVESRRDEALRQARKKTERKFGRMAREATRRKRKLQGL